ncbi:hypothetical protein C8A00DRAFT_11115 [Chaetomidium leptoderma]|uniref:ABM domain-containing protein n=1 Tax=Chaetomidium leptoderma TaxID=669021 RepID=A0AAN7A1I9_9PEZI|nr:hypothetical protein C8A00DRAFT_11115 [Chaetomidium leptoderma]
MPRRVDRARWKVNVGDPVLTLARTHVPLDRPLPPPIGSEPENPGSHSWRDLLGVIETARGCKYVACSRVAETPETVIFVLVWWDQECLDEFKASPDYTVFLVSLGMLDITPVAGGVSGRTIQTIKFDSWEATRFSLLEGWLALYTVALAHPVTDAQREVRLQGPRYRRNSIGNVEWHIMMINLPEPRRSQGVQHGWVQELRQIVGEGKKIETTVQDAFFYTGWPSKEAEEKMKTALPEVEFGWDDELREIGAIEAKEEHVDLVWIAQGRDHNWNQVIGVTIPKRGIVQHV